MVANDDSNKSTSIEDKLKLLSLADSYSVKEKKGGVYEVESNEDDLAAQYDPGYGWTYFMIGCYNSGQDWREISLKQLSKLVKFTKFLSR